MKKSITVSALLLFLTVSAGWAQQMRCEELVTYARTNATQTSINNCTSSAWLIKVVHYKVNEGGMVIAYIKQNEYDYVGKPYIYCGISYNVWLDFMLDAIMSCGESFHKHIAPYKCDCY